MLMVARCLHEVEISCELTSEKEPLVPRNSPTFFRRCGTIVLSCPTIAVLRFATRSLRHYHAAPTTAQIRHVPAEEIAAVADGFDWNLQPVTMADLEVGHPWAFEHTKPNLSDAEMEDYIRLIRAAKDRRKSIGLYLPDDVNITSAWESAFYRFAEARRQAWNNGTLLLQPARSGLANPFDSNRSLNGR